MSVFCGVPARKIDLVWPAVEPLVEKACALGHVDFSPENVRASLLKREAQLWVAGHLDGVIVTHVEVRPKRKVAVIQVVAGDEIEMWKDMEGVLSAWAKEQGCHAIEGTGRLGWKAIAKEFGWKPVTMTFRKDLYDA